MAGGTENYSGLKLTTEAAGPCPSDKEILSTKHQIPNNTRIQMTKYQNTPSLDHLDFEYCNLFGYWDFGFRISSPGGRGW